MNAPSSRIGGLFRRFRRDDSGSIIVLVALCVVALLGVAGLALDMGRLYIQRARLSNIADAAALAGARSIRQGQTAARQQALAIAAANGFVDGQNGVAIGTTFGSNSLGEQTVTATVTAAAVPLILMRPLMNQSTTVVRSSAVAAVMPIDMILVLDQSTSLSMADAWDDLQRAATDFVNLMDDERDQVGLVSFHLRAVQRRPLQQNFKTPLGNLIRNMNTSEGTNLGQGLAFALNAMQPPHLRARALKVVVVFTDGQPNAFRATMGNRDRILMADQGYMFGYFDNPNSLPQDDFRYPDGCVLAPTCFGYNPQSAESAAVNSALTVANQLRSQNVYVYTIGLGNRQSDPWIAPDLGLLRRLANEGGIASASQPQGRMYFAPTSDDLVAAFQGVASDLMTRLTQ